MTPSKYESYFSVDNENNVEPSIRRLPALVPRSAYVEDNTMRELHQKLVSLASPNENDQQSPTSIIPVSEFVETNSFSSPALTFDRSVSVPVPVMETEEEDAVAMRVTRSKSFIMNHQNISHQINRCEES